MSLQVNGVVHKTGEGEEGGVMKGPFCHILFPNYCLVDTDDLHYFRTYQTSIQSRTQSLLTPYGARSTKTKGTGCKSPQIADCNLGLEFLFGRISFLRKKVKLAELPSECPLGRASGQFYLMSLKPWPNGLASRRKFWTCFQLAFRLANHLR